MSKEKALTPKQQAYCREYLVDLNQMQAAIRAGYSARTANKKGWELFQNPRIKAEIQKNMDKRVKRTEITADYVLNGINEVVKRCMQEVEPLTTKDGVPVMVENKAGDMVPAFTFNSSGALKGFELLGKHLKLFTDVSEQNVNYTRMDNVKVGDNKGHMHELHFDIGKDPDNELKSSD